MNSITLTTRTYFQLQSQLIPSTHGANTPERTQTMSTKLTSARLTQSLPRLVISLCLLLTTFLSAQDAAKPKLDLTLSDAKEVRTMKDGKEVIELLPVTSTQGGDVLLYTIAYVNNGATAADGASITGVIPEGTRLILGSQQQASDLDVVFSINGGESFLPLPITIPVKKDDGKVFREPAPADLFTHIKWQLTTPLPPGTGGKVSYKVKVK